MTDYAVCGRVKVQHFKATSVVFGKFGVSTGSRDAVITGTHSPGCGGSTPSGGASVLWATGHFHLSPLLGNKMALRLVSVREGLLLVGRSPFPYSDVRVIGATLWRFLR